MTAISIAGAASHGDVDWHAIDWPKVHTTVRRLQARIVQATKAGRWGKVKALQRLLTHSFSGKALAVKRVTENPGKRTPGVDGQTWETPAKKATAVDTLRQRGYRAQPLRRVYIPKSNGQRPLGIPTIFDRAMQALYLLALDPVAETTADPNSYGFRKDRSPADAIVQCHTLLSGPNRPAWILEGDIKACFDRISFDWLVTNIPMEKVILQQWLKAGYMERTILFPTERGTPQGGICSPVLANMTLDGLEQELLRAFLRANNGPTPKVNLVRFADDFIVTGRSKELLEQEVKPLVERFMQERGLELSQEKTSISHIEDGFDFLGKHIRKYRNGVVLTTPSKMNVKTFLRKVRETIKANKAVDAGTLVVMLNPLLQGWAQYHQHGAAMATFNDMDHAIFQSLWRWAQRRHPKKARRWVKAKYFRTIGGRTWVFHGDHDGKPRCLFKLTSVRMTRHVKVKGEANPYDPEWEVYFEHRLGVKMTRTLRGRRQLLSLWKEQEGTCPVCNQKMSEMTEWHNHHIIWRSKGGTDTAANRVLLHPTCHRKVHSQGLYVEKPRPERGDREA